VAPGDVLLNVFQTQPGDSFPAAYTVQSNDLTAFLNAHGGQTLTLRFAEVDNNDGPLNFGVDSVSLVVQPALAVPEPSSLALFALGTAALLGYTWRKRRQAA
jgi:hypothetical protein